MESWSFPPAYDAEYFPERSARYWFPRRETMPAAEREMLERMATIQADLAIVPIGTHAQYDRTDAQAI